MDMVDSNYIRRIMLLPPTAGNYSPFYWPAAAEYTSEQVHVTNNLFSKMLLIVLIGGDFGIVAFRPCAEQRAPAMQSGHIRLNYAGGIICRSDAACYEHLQV